MPDANTYLLCYAQDAVQTTLLLFRRQFIQKRVDGQAVQGRIPAWAGQWGTVVGQPKGGQSLEDTARAAFLAQTGLDLGDARTSAAYGVVTTGAKRLQDSNYNPVPVFYVACSPTGLASLASDIQAKLLANAPADGVLQAAELKHLAEARNLIGPVSPPPDGWRNFLVQNYWDGKPPGQLNTEIDTLTAAIATSSAEPPTGFQIAIDNLPRSGTPPSPPVGQGDETYGKIANNNPYPITVRATVENPADWASATNRPDKTFAGVTIAAFGEIGGRADLASAANSARVRVEMTVEHGAEPIVFSYDQKTALSSADYESIGVFGNEPQYLVTQTTGTSNEVTPELTLIISENRED